MRTWHPRPHRALGGKTIAPQGSVWALVGALGVLAAHPAAAQLTNIVPQGSPIPRMTPQEPPQVGPALRAPPVAPTPNVPNQVVTIRSVSIQGATAFTPAQLDPIVAGLVGQVNLQQIEKAREALVERYRADNFAFTAVKATVDARGGLTFTVTEGHIADVKLEGDIGPAGTQVLRFLKHLTEVRPIDTASMERWLLLAQDVPGVTLRAILRPSTDEPGALTLVAQVSRQAWSGLVTADNRGAPFTGPAEGLAVLNANSFTSLGEQTTLSLFSAFDGTQIFGQAATEAFVGGSGLKVRVYAGSGTTNPSGQLASLYYHGVTTTAGVSTSYPIIRSRQQTLSVSGYFDLLESNIHTGKPSSLASYDNLRVFRIGADYAAQDLLLGGDRSAISTVSLRGSQGIAALGATQTSAARVARIGATPSFTKGTFQISRTQNLFQAFPGGQVALQATLAGQGSSDILPPAEKFFLGGMQFNRGYYSGEAAGDSALTSAIELQLNTGFSMDVFSRPVDVQTQFYTFWDWGETWNNIKQDPNQRLVSWGGGVRANITKYTEFDLEGVKRVTLTPTGYTNVPPLHATAVYWRVLTRF